MGVVDYLKQLCLFLSLFICICLHETVSASEIGETMRNHIIEQKKHLFKRDTLTISDDTLILSRRVFYPDHFIAQYAGNIGFMAIGAGYDIGKRSEVTLLYGFLNEYFGDSQVSVHTLSLKNSFALTNELTCLNFKPLLGMSVNWGYTQNTFHKLPDHYPDKYYFQNKVHLAPFVGGNFAHRFKKTLILESLNFYFEISSLDAYLLEWVRRDYVKLIDVLSMSVGLKIELQ